MPDILIKLYEINEAPAAIPGIEMRRPLPHEKSIIKQWIASHFSAGWADECEVAFKNSPVSCFMALSQNRIVGFACYEATLRGFFGPTGVDEKFRGKGVGKALLIKSLLALKELGYAYAIIGGAGPVDFYVKSVGGIPIPDSYPGIYPANPISSG